MPRIASAPSATGTVVLPPAAPIDPTAAAVEVLDEPVVPEPAPTEAPPAPTEAPAPPAPPPVVAAPTRAPAPPPPPPTATPVPPPPPPPAAPPAAPVATGLGSMEAAMFSQHNQQRAGAGLGALSVDASLTNIARRRAQDMAAKNYFAHTSPTGETAFTLMNGAGYV